MWKIWIRKMLENFLWTIPENSKLLDDDEYQKLLDTNRHHLHKFWKENKWKHKFRNFSFLLLFLMLFFLLLVCQLELWLRGPFMEGAYWISRGFQFYSFSFKWTNSFIFQHLFGIFKRKAGPGSSDILQKCYPRPA